MSSEKVDKGRRSTLKYGIAAVVAAAAAGGGVAAWQLSKPKPAPTPAPAPTPTPAPTPAPGEPTPTPTPAPLPLVMLIDAASSPPEMVDAFTKETGIPVSPEFADIFTILHKILATKGEGFDAYWADSNFGGAWIESGLLQPVPVDKIPHWKPEYITKLWTEPETLELFPGCAEQIKNYTWFPGREGKDFRIPPFHFGMDSYGYLPELIERDLTSMGELVNREFKGKVTIEDIPTVTINDFSAYLYYTEQMPEPEIAINDLTPPEIDFVIDWLIGHKKAGQFKTFWAGFAEVVSQFVARDVWLGQMWCPAVFAIRRAGTPLKYADKRKSDGGFLLWAGSEVPTPITDKLEEVYTWMNWRIGGTGTELVALYNGYYTPTYKSPEVKKAMEPELWEWWYEHKRTYKPIDEIIPDRPERIANALFDPLAYEWSPIEGKEHPHGAIWELRTLDERVKDVGTYSIWSRYGDYYASAWDRFKVA